jgi:hypothetical protein
MRTEAHTMTRTSLNGIDRPGTEIRIFVSDHELQQRTIDDLHASMRNLTERYLLGRKTFLMAVNEDDSETAD